MFQLLHTHFQPGVSDVSVVAYTFPMAAFFERAVQMVDTLVTDNNAAPGKLEQAGSI
jgi:hypothetical protein